MAPGGEGPLSEVVVEPPGKVVEVVGEVDDTYTPSTFPRVRNSLNGLPVHLRKVAVNSLIGEEDEVVR